MAVGVSRRTGWRWFADAGGVKPTFPDETAPRSRPRLSVEEREEIQDGIARGESIRSIARRLGRAPSTVMREINRNGSFRYGTLSGAVSLRCSLAWRLGSRPAVSGRQAHTQPWGNAAAAGRASWPLIGVCTTRCRPGWKMNSTAPSRSPRGCRSTSPTMRRCGCLTRPSISRFTFKAKGICAASCTRACAPGGPCVNRIAVPMNVAAGSPTWSTSASAQPTSLTVQCPGTGRAT